MRFIRQQIIVTTVFNEELKDNSIIAQLLKNIKNSSVDCVIEYVDSRTEMTKSYDKVRIKNFNDEKNTVDLQIFQKTATISVNGLAVENLKSIKIATNKNNIISGNENLTKADFIDI